MYLPADPSPSACEIRRPLLAVGVRDPKKLTIVSCFKLKGSQIPPGRGRKKIEQSFVLQKEEKRKESRASWAAVG